MSHLAQAACHHPTYRPNHGELLGDTPMNWTRGFLRLWAALAVCWVGGVGYLTGGKLGLSKNGFFDSDKYLEGASSSYSLLPDWKSLVGFGELVLLPPLGLLLLGFMAVWALRGFRP